MNLLIDRVAASEVVRSKKYTDKQKAEYICGVFSAVPAKVARKKLGPAWVRLVGRHNCVKIGRFVVCDRVAFEDAGGAVWSKTAIAREISPLPGRTKEDIDREASSPEAVARRERWDKAAKIRAAFLANANGK